MSIADRVAVLILQHGGLRQAARALSMDHAYLSRLLHGAKKNPSAAVLRKLKLRRTITYTSLDAPR